MQINKADILIRKEKGIKVLWLSEAFLLSCCAGLSDTFLRTKARFTYRQSVSPCMRDNSILPDTGTAWRWAKIDGRFYYSYSNIPDKSPANYKSKLPTCNELLELHYKVDKENSLCDIETHVRNVVNDIYKNYLPAYRNCTPIQQNNLAKAASFIEAIVFYIRNNEIDIRKNELFIQLAALVENEDYKYLPKNFRKLKEKILEANTGIAIAEVIKLPRAGNTNAGVFSSDSQLIGMIYQLAGMQQNFSHSFVIRKIQTVCALIGKETPSNRWIGSVLESHNLKFLTAKDRYGSKGRHGAIYSGYIPIEGALFAGDAWQIDGTRFNIIDHKTDDGKAFLYVVVVRDVHSGDALGWHFSHSEDHTTVLHALRMAVKETGYLPYEIVCDRFPGHNTEQMINFFEELTQRGIKITVAHKATGKAQQERWFGTLQTVFMQESNYYYGEGVKSRRRFSHRSVEYVSKVRKEAHKEGWDFDKASNHANEIVESYRNTNLSFYSRKHQNIDKSPAQLHAESEKPNVLLLNEAEITYLFGIKKTVSLKNDGLIKTEIFKTEYYFRTKDYSIISKYPKVIMCYDLEDLSHIHLYAPGKKVLSLYLGTAYNNEKAQVFGPNAQFNQLAKQKQIIAEIEEKKAQELSQYRQASGFDANLLMAGIAPKGNYESAETGYLLNEWSDSDIINLDVRNQY
jgi:hypothetical protein